MQWSYNRLQIDIVSVSDAILTVFIPATFFISSKQTNVLDGKGGLKVAICFLISHSKQYFLDQSDAYLNI